MKVGYVLKEFPRLTETFILTELLSLERLGMSIRIFSRYEPAGPVPHEAVSRLRAQTRYLETLLRERFWEPFEIHRRLARRHGARHDRAMEMALAQRSRQELRYWLLAAAVAEDVEASGIEWIHAHFATGNASVARYASAITGIPFSFTAHAKDIYSDEVDRGRLASLLEEAALVVTVSDMNAAFLREIAPTANISRIYNGLDLERFQQRTAPPIMVPPIVLSVARLVEKKGLADLVAAVARLVRGGRDLRLRLVGSGPLEQQLRAQAEQVGIGREVEFVGEASQEEVALRHLAEAAVFALPCVIAADGDRDGLPTTLLEAMACGVPVVSTTLPGIPEAAPHGEAGLLVTPGDVAGIAEALARTLDEREETERRVKFARARVERLFCSRTNAVTLRDSCAATRQAACVTEIRL